MPTGLQVYAPDGSVRLEITDRLTRLVSTTTYAPWHDATTRFIAVSDMTNDGHWAVVYDSQAYIHSIGNGGVTIASQYPYAPTEHMAAASVAFSIYRT